MIDGAAAGLKIVFGVVLGTGCGGGLVINQAIITGANAVAGEWGHIPLPRMTPEEQVQRCGFCGRLGCNEIFISGTGFATQFKAETNRRLTPAEIVAAAEEGDEEAKKALELFEDRLARAFSTLIQVIDPDAIVIGGGLSEIGRIYQNVPQLISKYTLDLEGKTQILKAKHGGSSGARGAAWLSAGV